MPDCDSPDSLTDVLSVFGDRPSLLCLNVNTICMDEHNAPVLANIDGLHELELSNPTRVILNILPEWLNRLSKSLVTLHLMVNYKPFINFWSFNPLDAMLQDNCGYVTPGILRSLLPHIRDIRAFSLGLSYSLTVNDISTFLGELVDLETLQLRYHFVCLLPICHNLHI